METKKKTANIEHILENSAIQDSYISGFMFAYGRKDYKTAIEILENVASLGNLSAQLKLGEIYELNFEGYGIKYNPEKAIKWYKKAALQKKNVS